MCFYKGSELNMDDNEYVDWEGYKYFEKCKDYENSYLVLFIEELDNFKKCKGYEPNYCILEPKIHYKLLEECLDNQINCSISINGDITKVENMTIKSGYGEKCFNFFKTI